MTPDINMTKMLPDVLHAQSISNVTYSFPCTVLDRPRTLQEVEAPRILRKSTHEGGKVVSPPPPQREGPWYAFVLQSDSTSGPQCSRKD